MKIEIKKDDQAQTSGIETRVMSFDMQKTAKLFHMLSNTLYSDKLNSINRELASNCHDSHYLAGNLDKPFVIKAPTYEHPFYEIRDYGVGLTEEEANDTILCYLGSDKDDRSDLIGGWGIGAKSPFAYTTTYEVIVYKNGEMTHFTCWKDETGIPQTAVIDKGETDEPTGVLMRMPVESVDIRIFESKLREYINWTNYNVELHVGDKVITSRTATAEKSFDNFVVKVYPNGSGARRLVYGGFSYAMDQCVDNRYDYSGHWMKIQQKLRHGYDVAFVIDEPNVVSFAMNREVLEHTEKSRNFVNSMINTFGEVADEKYELVNKMSAEFFGKMNHAKTLKEVDDFIVELDAQIKKQDTSFDSVFVSNETTITFEFQTCDVIKNRGVYPLRKTRIKPLATNEQFLVAYGRLSKPGPSARNEFISNIESNETPLYIKAKTEDEARQIIKYKPEFADYDLSTLKFLEVVIPKRQSSSQGSRGLRSLRTKPVPYCREQKKRYSWDSDDWYVICNKLSDSAEAKRNIAVEYCEEYLRKTIIYLVPTDNFREEAEDRENVFSVEDLVEVATQEMYSNLDYIVSAKDERKIWKLKSRFYTLRTKLNTPDFISEEIREIEEKLAPFKPFNGYTEVSAELKAYLERKIVNNSSFKRLQKEANGVIIKQKKLAPFSQYIRLDNVLDGSEIGEFLKRFISERCGVNV